MENSGSCFNFLMLSLVINEYINAFYSINPALCQEMLKTRRGTYKIGLLYKIWKYRWNMLYEIGVKGISRYDKR